MTALLWCQLYKGVGQLTHAADAADTAADAAADAADVAADTAAAEQVLLLRKA